MKGYSYENHKKTRTAFLGTRLLNTPFWAMFNMIPFILFKDLFANAFQITAVTILKPAVSLIALYWIATFVRSRSNRLKKHIVLSQLFGFIPFFFLPLIHDAWFMVFAYGFYMIMYRGSIPAWMEVLKLNMPGASRSRVFAFGASCGYIGDAVWPLLLGWLLDSYELSWQWIFPVTALISMSSIFIQMKMKIIENEVPDEHRNGSAIIGPWKSAWILLKKRPDFLRYQIGYMLGGSGVMILQPALPQFFMGTLQLTYTELGVAITLCKGVGFALSSQLWAKLIHKVDLYRFASWVTFLAAFVPLCLISAVEHQLWLYFAYILYGVMQGGSEMGWNMSGPIFAKNEDSSIYSSVNIMTQGIRGCFVPAIGGLLATLIGPFAVMLTGTCLCLIASNRMSVFSKWSRESGESISLET